MEEREGAEWREEISKSKRGEERVENRSKKRRGDANGGGGRRKSRQNSELPGPA